MTALADFLIALALAPLLPGIINRVKAFFAGRQGQSPFQLYYDLLKLLRKGAVYSTCATYVFRLGPVIGLAAMLGALAVMPGGSGDALHNFDGGIIFFAYLLALARFAAILAALDTGSSFEGMGASREALYSALAEPPLFVALAMLVKTTGGLSFEAAFPDAALLGGTPRLLAAAALFLVFLAENCRIPTDDPNTHLELTMMHEVMVLDHSGPDFAFISYGAALKMWVLGALTARFLLPFGPGFELRQEALFLAAMFAIALLTGVVESCMARLRLNRVPAMLLAALALSFAAFVTA
ncbi:MAG: hydrogenase [Elusimicrobia bacterium]|nr:hydrogenase [Elusimicrobiota bacterium]